MQTIWREVGERGSGNRRALGRNGRATAPVMIGVLILAALFRPLHTFAQGDDEAEYQVKLAFLYNFAQFVNWPPEAFRNSSAPLEMCVAGQDPFRGEIEDSLRSRLVGGHPIEVKRLKANDDPKSCHIIFVRAGDKRLSERILAAVRGSNTLTVGESKGFTDVGGVINLTREENKLRFEINLDIASQTRLKISSKLLALAKIVKTPP